MTFAHICMLALAFPFVIGCAAIAFDRWFHRHWRRIPYRKLDYTSGQYASKDFK